MEEGLLSILERTINRLEKENDNLKHCLDNVLKIFIKVEDNLNKMKVFFGNYDDEMVYSYIEGSADWCKDAIKDIKEVL